MRTEKKDFSIVTELPETEITFEQMQRIYCRYAFASEYVKNKRVLEIGFGGGQGLGLLLDAGAKSVAGVDIDASNVRTARAIYDDERVTLIQGDIAHLDFAEQEFDCILMFEVVYYLENAEEVLSQCKSLLSEHGTIIIQTVNCDWPGFYPSPYSTRYYNSFELFDLLQKAGFVASLYSAFPVEQNVSAKARIKSLLHRVANTLHLIPRTMQGKALLKKIFLGEMVRMPSRFHEGICPYIEPTPLDLEAYNPHFKVIIGVGEKLLLNKPANPTSSSLDRLAGKMP